MLDAMMSFQNGFLATVVGGNQHSLQAAHRELCRRERESETRIENDSVDESLNVFN